MTDYHEERDFLLEMKEKMAEDHFAGLAEIEITAARPGYAKAKMLVKEKHLNAAGVVQGGAIFTLADFTLAVAANCGSQLALVTDSNIAFLAPAKAGTTLWSETEQLSDTRNLTSYVVKITDETDCLIAQYYGRAFKKK